MTARTSLLRALVGLMVSASLPAVAAPSNASVFRRCYALITQSYAEPSHDLLMRVQAGSLDPITACLLVLDKADFDSTGKVPAADAEAKRVLNTFHALHYSWFSVRDFDTSQPDSVRNSTRDLYDPSSPALYFTRALFDPKAQFKEILTTTNTYGSVRTTMDPDMGTYSKAPKSQYVYKGGTLQNSAVGDLLGVRTIAPMTVTPGSTALKQYGNITLYRHFGGGVIGSSPYVTFTVRQESGSRSNAGVAMPRKWTLALAKDILCRDLPLIRTADAQKYVSATAPIAFRQIAGCTRCHASIDQMAATIRQVALTSYESGYAAKPPTRPYPVLSASLATIHKGLDQPAEMTWPTGVDVNYYRRPTKGRLVLRSIDGSLVDEPVNNLQELGNRLSQLDDPYVCAASRYWEYFVGARVPIIDQGDPEVSQQLSAEEKKQFDEIVKLAKAMKTHQRPRVLIEAILKHPAFRNPASGGTP